MLMECPHKTWRPVFMPVCKLHIYNKSPLKQTV